MSRQTRSPRGNIARAALKGVAIVVGCVVVLESITGTNMVIKIFLQLTSLNHINCMKTIKKCSLILLRLGK